MTLKLYQKLLLTGCSIIGALFAQEWYRRETRTSEDWFYERDANILIELMGENNVPVFPPSSFDLTDQKLQLSYEEIKAGLPSFFDLNMDIDQKRSIEKEILTQEGVEVNCSNEYFQKKAMEFEFDIEDVKMLGCVFLKYLEQSAKINELI